MSSFSTPGKILHLPLLLREHTSDAVGVISREGGCLTPNHTQMSVSELCLMEILEAEYAHLQHRMPMHVKVGAGCPEGPDDDYRPATVTVKEATPLTATQAIDLSSTTDEHRLLMAGEMTPLSHGEVPGFVLASVREEDSPSEPHSHSSTSSLKRSRSAVRVRLDQRFNTMSTDTPTPQDIQSPAPSNFLAMLQQSAESQETVVHPQRQKLMKTEGANPFEVIGCIPHMVYPKHQGLIKCFPFDCHQEMVASRAHYTCGNNSTEGQQLVITEDAATSAASSRSHGSTQSCPPIEAAETTPDSTGKSGRKTMKRARVCVPVSQRRELHNSRERDRRTIIRSCCDELNMLVPFCNSDSDKATTLQWTTAFLRYINKTYGDVFREEFMVLFTDDKGVFPLPRSLSDQNRIHQERNETAIAVLGLEQ